MLHHRTTDPVSRLEHVINRIDRQHQDELKAAGRYPYEDWPNFWLEAYDEIAPEFLGMLTPPRKDQP